MKCQVLFGKKAVTCKNDIDAEELPEIVEPKLGDKVKIKIRGIIGFSQNRCTFA